MKLSELKEGDKFCFVKARRKPQGKPYIVEGQYPLKKITTVFSEERIMTPGIEPIAVNNTHDVKLLLRAAYNTVHCITRKDTPKKEKTKTVTTATKPTTPKKKTYSTPSTKVQTPEEDKKQYRYAICDCEHEGDIRYAVHEVEEAGGNVVSTEWDGHDCGEAWVIFTLKKGVTLQQIQKELGSIYAY